MLKWQKKSLMAGTTVTNIPLLKPSIPKPYKWQKYLNESYAANMYTNFGINYQKAVEALVSVPVYNNSHAVLVSNGTVAITTALKATLPRGSRIAVPHFTFMATLNAVYEAGMTPVLVESNKDTWAIDEALLEANSSLYDAFIVVSPMGHWVNVDSYDRLARKLNKKVVYDFAAAAFHKISPVHPTTLSFHATKNIPIGEGGAILFPNAKQAEKASQLINFDFDSLKYPQGLYGTNAKLDELHCSLLRYQLTDNLNSIQKDVDRKLQLTLEYIKELEPWFTVHQSILLSKPQLTVLMPKSSDILTSSVNALNANNIASRLYYSPTLLETLHTLNIPKIVSNKPLLSSGLALPSYKGAPIKDIVGFIKKALL